jgi:soluble lytic murein transglycosylase-like protein
MLLILVFMPSREALAFEEPVAGMADLLDAVKDDPIEKAVAYYSAIYRLDSNLVLAIIEGESRGDTHAYNSNDNGTHDSGLMQINSCNHEWLRDELGITDFYEPTQNIKAGVYILSLLTAKYDSLHRVLMCYNMGEFRTSQLWQQGIYSSRYSRGIIKKYLKLKGGMITHEKVKTISFTPYSRKNQRQNH